MHKKKSNKYKEGTIAAAASAVSTSAARFFPGLPLSMRTAVALSNDSWMAKLCKIDGTLLKFYWNLAYGNTSIFCM